MRGTLAVFGERVVAFGLIPTYAGNTVCYGVDFDVPGAHPHVCGEHTCCGPFLIAGLGSSPRMRGTLAPL